MGTDDQDVIEWTVEHCERAAGHKGTAYPLATAWDIRDLVDAARKALSDRGHGRDHLLGQVRVWPVPDSPADPAARLLITVTHRGLHLATEPLPARDLLGALPAAPDSARPGTFAARTGITAVLPAVLGHARRLAGLRPGS
jgi:hypothetical protein